MFGQHLRP